MQKPLELTKTQQKHTLSAKKKKQQTPLKNILAQPFPRYWPQINISESKEFFSLLNEVKTLDPNHFARKKSDTPHPIAYGLSSSLRRIKHGGVRVLVLSADLKPRYVINQIILLALARNEAINILCVSNLEQEVKSLVDFQCFALSINDTPASAFHKLFDWCRIVTSERYPVPQLIQTYFSARRRPSTEIKSIPMETEPESTESTETPLSSFYLTRSSTAPEQRAFLPKNAINFKPLSFDVASLGQIKSDFISLDAFDSDGNSDKDINSVSSPSSVPSAMQPHEAKGTKHKPIHIKKVMKGAERYQPAKIKRFTGNPGKKKNNGKPKLTREQKKEIRKTMKMAKRNNSNNK